MDDCEFYGSKHKLYIVRAHDMWLVGHVEFACRKCSSRVMVDRFWFYQALKTPKGTQNGD